MKTFLASKIHRAIVTHADINYEGSIGISKLIMEYAGIMEYEQVHVFNINNGERFITYAFPVDEGLIHVNGAAARKVSIGDRLIVCSFDTIEIEHYKSPTVILVNENNFQFTVK